MATVRSAWTTAPLAVDGFLTPAEWSSAGSLPIPAGFLMAKNDASSLYIALDVVGDTGNDAGTNDYFWLYVDVDRNGSPTAHRDLLFSLFPGQPNRLGKWPVLGPGITEPVPNTQVIASSTRRGFGSSPNSAVAHRIWETRLDLAEIGVDLAASSTPPVVKVGIRVASSTPAFIFDTPSNVAFDFSHFHDIVLSTSPDPGDYAGLAGLIMGGVGLIPATTIDATTGLATTAATYRLPVTNAGFGGVLDVLGNNVTITSMFGGGARKFIVRHRYGATLAAANAAAWTHLRTSWTNYRWDGTTYVLEPFGPDASDMYPILDPAGDYSIQKLLFEWSSYTAPGGFHQFELDFFNAGGGAFPAPGPQRLTIFVDNTAPDTRLVDILHGGAPVAPCGMITLSGPADGVQVVYRAFDPEGLLHSYSVTAAWGQDQSAGITSDTYVPAHAGSPSWTGVSPSATSPLFHPPITCAYTFRVSASGRVTNGYGFIQFSSSFRNITINVPFIVLKAPVRAEVKALTPFGFTGGTAIKGTTPAKLGKETIPLKP